MAATAAFCVGSATTGVPASATVPVPSLPQIAATAADLKPTPEGNVTMEDVTFLPIERSAFPGLLAALQVRFGGGDDLTLLDQAGKALWTGPLAQARFTQETAGGAHTVKDANGQTVWSNAAEVAAPDLLLRKAPDGQAWLIGKDGGTLWSGQLTSTSIGSTGSRSSSSSRNHTYSVQAAGVHIQGMNGEFTVKEAAAAEGAATEGRLLWSGRLPQQPVLLVLDGPRFSFVGRNRSEVGYDRTSQVRFESEMGSVTVADTQGRTLGTRPIYLLKISSQEQATSRPQPPLRPVQTLTPNPRLSTQGTVLLTYRDASGQVIRRAKAYRTQNSTGVEG